MNCPICDFELEPMIVSYRRVLICYECGYEEFVGEDR